MSKKSLIQSIGEKEMDRKEFLKYGGLFLLGIIGLKSFANLLTKINEEDNGRSGRGFGSGKYGV